MPPVARHLKTSIERTGNEYRELHEWLDNDPEKKAERHDITKIYEHGRMIEKVIMFSLNQTLSHIPVISLWVPTAISGTSAYVTELIPVTSSGRDVTDAMRTTPIHVLPRPVFSAIISPYLESLVPE